MMQAVSRSPADQQHALAKQNSTQGLHSDVQCMHVFSSRGCGCWRAY